MPLPSSDKIDHLEGHQVFVFGSNLAGRHGAGAARDALRFGARWGVGDGPSGQTYAIPTKNDRLETVHIAAIRTSVDRFIEYARKHPDTEFLVTRIGCRLAGYADEDIAPLFRNSPNNVRLPKSFIRILDRNAVERTVILWILDESSSEF